jgi:hypothetical protein
VSPALTGGVSAFTPAGNATDLLLVAQCESVRAVTKPCPATKCDRTNGYVNRAYVDGSHVALESAGGLSIIHKQITNRPEHESRNLVVGTGAHPACQAIEKCAPTKEDSMADAKPMFVINLRLDHETQERRRRLEALYEVKLPGLVEMITRHAEKHILASLNEEQRQRYLAKQLPKLEYRGIVESKRAPQMAAE